MTKYIVVKDFTDLDDRHHIYRAGEPYPRSGYEPTPERIEALSGTNNKRNEVLIQAKEELPDEPEFALENLSADAIREQYTNKEIRARLDDLGVEHKSNDTKEELIEKLLAKRNEG